jgi:thiamine transporter ThiT
VAVAARPIRPTLSAPELVMARGNLAAVRLLAGLVGVSFVVRALLGWLRAAPVYFGDEYLYSSIAKSIAETGRPLVRGGSAHFPALLQPLLTAPAWLVDDVGVAYHLAQTLGALAMSLAAVPVYWLARRLGLSAAVALGLAVLTLVLPDLVYATWMVAEPFAYPLALAAVAAAVAALDRPSRRTQLAFVALAGLAAFARIQFVILPVCFLGALVVVGLRERRLRSAVKEQLLPLVLFALPVAVTVALGSDRVLAYYKGVVHPDIHPVALAESSGMNLLVLVFSSGFVLVPGAVLGLLFALGRARSRTELAFGAMTALVLVALLVEAGTFGAFEQAQERYLFYVLPLVAIAFGLYASRGWPRRLFHALLGAGLVTLAAVVPLAGYAAADEKAHSPVLYGVFRIEQWLGSPGNGSLAVAVAATVGLAALVASSARPRIAAAVGLSLAVVLSAGLGAASVVFDHENSGSVRKSFLPSDPSWVDHAQLGDVTLLRNIAGIRGGAFQQLFWNRSVKRLALMPGAPEIDAFRADRVRVADDGSLLAGGHTLTGALLVDEHAVTTRFTGVGKVASAPGYSLYRPEGRPRLSLFLLGRYHDGWLADRGTINLWPRPGSDRLRGTLVFDVESPAPLEATTLDLQLPGGRRVHVLVPAGGSTNVELPVCSRGPWATGFRSKVRGFVGARAVSVQAGVPRFVPGKKGCTAAPKQTPAPPGTPGATA